MKTKQAIEYFGGVARLAHALRIWPQSIYTWGEHPPIGKQYEIHVKSGGRLPVDDSRAQDGNDSEGAAHVEQ
jgi:hypothetical protein